MAHQTRHEVFAAELGARSLFAKVNEASFGATKSRIITEPLISGTLTGAWDLSPGEPGTKAVTGALPHVRAAGS